MKLLDYAWNIVTSVGGRDHQTLRLILDQDLTNPVLTSDRKGMVIKIPIPTTKEGFYSLHGLFFDQDEKSWASLWHLFRASLYHTAVHAAYSDFKAYSAWARGKDILGATYSVALVEDLHATMKAAKAWSGIMGDIAYSNYISALRLPRPDKIEEPALRFASKLLLSAWGVSRRNGDEEEDKEVNEVAQRVRTRVRAAAQGKADGGALAESAQDVYAAVMKRGHLREVPALPFTEAHGECTLFDSKLVEERDSSNLLTSAYTSLRLDGPNPDEEKLSSMEAAEFRHDLALSQQRLNRVTQVYDELISTTRLDGVEFPKGDLASYLRVKSALAGPIKNIRDQLRQVKNVLDETTGHDSGQIDTQEAMQVIASESARTDVFLRAEPATKDEAWAILVDASKSVASFSQQVKGITTCLAEVAKQLIPAQSQWALYAFNNTFQVIKDFTEEYTNEAKARVGGIVQRNFTLLPDAMSTAYKALASLPVDTKILVVASDGYATGYEGIDKQLLSTAESISKSGVLLMGVGIDSNALEQYFQVNCIVNSPYQMMKSFVRSYLELSSLF